MKPFGKDGLDPGTPFLVSTGSEDDDDDSGVGEAETPEGRGWGSSTALDTAPLTDLGSPQAHCSDIRDGLRYQGSLTFVCTVPEAPLRFSRQNWH